MKPPDELWASERTVSELVGRLMEFWGFRRNMGRIWAVLYLSDAPLSANNIRSVLSLSTGAVSMTLNELLRWGAIKRVRVPGERRDFFAAEINVWKMVSRVVAEREVREVAAAVDGLERSVDELQPKLTSGTLKQRQRASFMLARINGLLTMARMGQRLLAALLATAKLDAAPLAEFEVRPAGREDPRTEIELEAG